MTQRFKKGFTLVELLIAVSLFVIVASISIGAILSVFDANKKAQSSKTVVDNLNLAIENMARTVRFGSNYHCANIGDLEDTRDCNNDPTNDIFLAVTFFDEAAGDNVLVTYEWDTVNHSIKKTYDGVDQGDITSADTVIEYMRFYVFGSTPSDSVQPYVVAVIKGHVGEKQSTQTNFSIQTLMSQRTLDV